MFIGIPERKIQEYRVALTPEAVHVLVERGHGVVVEKDAGCTAPYCQARIKLEG